jgi:hypothetical protein
MNLTLRTDPLREMEGFLTGTIKERQFVDDAVRGMLMKSSSSHGPLTSLRIKPGSPVVC